MRFKLKSRKHLELVAALTAGMMALVALLLAGTGVWSAYDYKALDFFYRKAVALGCAPQPSFSPQIVYLTITDDTYDYFGKNWLDRKELARVNDALAALAPEAVAYDIIFARPGVPESDRLFAESLRNLGTVFLPVGFAISETPEQFRQDGFRPNGFEKPAETGDAKPYYALRAVTQYKDFTDAAKGTGHISVRADADSLYRHVALFVRVDDRYVPSLNFSVFLDWAGVPMEKVSVEWGNRIVVPALKAGRLESDVIIPIDERGRVYIPFVDAMGKDFKEITVHTLLENFKDPDMRGNLMELFEGNIVLVADVAVGVSDLGATPLQTSVSLVTLHAGVLNGMLTNTFFLKWSFERVLILVLLMAFQLGIAALPRSSWFLYGSGMVILAGLIGFAWTEFVAFTLFPVVTVGTIFLAMFFSLIAALEIVTSRERAFIRSVFSRYVPEKVVNELLANPEALELGGQERKITVLFSDLADFTSISEKMSPTELVALLNEYLTEMADIVLKTGGIIDKFQGDAIMAEFGVPLSMDNHADQAVAAGLEMQRRLAELREEWANRGLPTLKCRVGINTGNMVVGNMGSKHVLDYTVMGDAVNLASRLEGANKRYGTFLMISKFTLAELTPGKFNTRILDVIKVKGKSDAVKVYEVYGETGDASEYHKTYHDAFQAYLSRDFVLAKKGFAGALSLWPDDLACIEMIGRIDAIVPGELPEDWDGSVKLTRK